MHDWGTFVRERLGPLTVSPEREAEIVAELAQQLEAAYTEALAGGAAEAEALRRTESHLGDWTRLAREIEAAERPAPPAPEYRAGAFAGIGQDARYALRFLRRNPAFAAIALATLAFGIGGNTAIFTMVDALVLRDLSYREPDQLMALETRRVDQPEIDPWMSAADFFDLRDRQHSFSAVAALSPVWNVVLTGRGSAEQLDALYATADFFPMLGVDAALGRTFSADEDRKGQPRAVVVLSHAYWQRRFGGSRDAIGQGLRLDGNLYTIIGVLPANFRWAGEPLSGTATDIKVWLPMAANQLVDSRRSVRYLKVVGRRRPEVSLAQSRDEIQRISAGLAAQYPEFDKGYASDGRPLREQVTGKLRSGMLLLLGTVGFVLVMVCANLANLLLARAALRQREITVRVAVGASFVAPGTAVARRGSGAGGDRRAGRATGGVPGPARAGGCRSREPVSCGRNSVGPARPGIHQRRGAAVCDTRRPAAGMAHGPRATGGRAARIGSRPGGRTSSRQVGPRRPAGRGSTHAVSGRRTIGA